LLEDGLIATELDAESMKGNVLVQRRNRRKPKLLMKHVGGKWALEANKAADALDKIQVSNAFGSTGEICHLHSRMKYTS
jgi:hypothetical protein